MLTGVQMLRGLAVLMVVFHHYVGAMAPKGWLSGAWTSTLVGNAGVDLFFIISGFIMEFTAGQKAGQKTTQPVASTSFSSSGWRDVFDFLARRAIRILPLLWVMTLLSAVIFVLRGPGESLRVDGLRLATSLLLLPDPREAMGADAFVIPMAWTLTYEAYFYLLFAATLRLNFWARWAALGIGFGASVLSVHVFEPQAPLLQMAGNPILWEFWAGCGLAHLYRTGVKLPTLLSGMVGIAAAALLLINPLTDWDSRLASWGMPAFLAVLAVVLARFEFRSKVLWGHWLAWVGDISYSLYLTHFFALSIFVQLLNRWGGDLKTWPLGCAVLFLVLTMSGAALSYRLIEQPSRRYFGRQWKSWRDKKWAVAEDVNV